MHNLISLFIKDHIITQKYPCGIPPGGIPLPYIPYAVSSFPVNQYQNANRIGL